LKLINIILFGLVQTKPVQSKTASLGPGPVRPSSGTGHDSALPQTGSVRTGGIIGEHVSWCGSDDLKANIEPPSCRQYKPGDILAVRPLSWDEIIDEDDDDVN